MSQADKRREYRCGKQYNTLENVPAWPEVYEQNKDRLQKIAKKPLNKPNETYEVNPEINKKVTIWRGDITTLEIDAIVNAANNSLLGGGGVDGAIHSAAGSSLKAECAPLKGCETGDAKITGGYKLPSKYVIHTVGPIGSSEAKLRSCYEKCLKIVKDDKLRSVAFPCISTGIYGYPNNQAAPVALETARTFLEKNHEHVDRIIFCLFLKVDVALYEEMMQWYFPIGNGYKSSDDINTAEQKDVAGDVEAAATPEVTESTESKEEVKRIKVEGGDAKDEEHGEDMSKMVSCDAVKEETDSRPDKETPSENTKSETNSVEVAESESKTVEVTESESKTVEMTESESKAVEGTESKSKTVEDTESISTTVEATQFGPTIEEADEKSVKCTETKL